MRTWDDYKNHVKAINEKERRNMEEIEEVSDIVSSSFDGGRSWESASGRLRSDAVSRSLR